MKEDHLLLHIHPIILRNEFDITTRETRLKIEGKVMSYKKAENV